MKLSTYPHLSVPATVKPAITLGNFDGVHQGHRSIIEQLEARARALSAPSVAMTFEPHPLSVLRPEAAPQCIQTPGQKQESLAALGIDHLVVVPFTLEFSKMEAEEFVRKVVAGELHAAELILGSNFRFGHGRAGDLDTLRGLGRELGFVVREVPPALFEGKMVSSSRVRAALAEGDVAKAAAMLGRAYAVDGRVVKGDGRGRLIGFHTANLDITGSLLVEDGVYVTSARLEGHVHRGMSHVGSRPTFGLDSRAVETHLFDFSQEIYGEPLRLYFHERIRGTAAFRGPEELRLQLYRDREKAVSFFRDRKRSPVL